MPGILRRLIPLGCVLALACGGERSVGPSESDAAARLDRLARGAPFAGPELSMAAAAAHGGTAVGRITVGGASAASGDYDAMALDVVTQNASGAIVDSALSIVAWRGTTTPEVLIVSAMTGLGQGSDGAIPAFRMGLYVKDTALWMSDLTGSTSLALQSTGASCPTRAPREHVPVQLVSCSDARISAAFDLTLIPTALPFPFTPGANTTGATGDTLRVTLSPLTLPGTRLVLQRTFPYWN